MHIYIYHKYTYIAYDIIFHTIIITKLPNIQQLFRAHLITRPLTPT